MAKRPIKFLLFPKKLTKTPKSLNSWPTGHFNQNTHVSIYRVIQTSDPPSQAKTGYAYQKLSNAFSNTIYLDIIWRLSHLLENSINHFLPISKIRHFGIILARKHQNNRQKRGKKDRKLDFYNGYDFDKGKLP